MNRPQHKFLASCKTNVSLAKFSSFGIGGPARYFKILNTISEAEELFASHIPSSIPILFLGNGSNCLFNDQGFNGLVILNKIRSIEKKENQFTVASGVSLAKLSRLTASLNFTGLEFGTGIPGTVGGSIVMNAGAHGDSISNTLHSILFFPWNSSPILFKKNDPLLSFSYRSSCFQNLKGFIIKAIFELTSDSYASKKEVAFRQQRLQSQPYQEKTAGCIFRNPPNLSAGKLIDQCGLKNFAYGNAFVSPQHANFIVNKKSASSQEVLTLIQIIKEKVFEHSFIHLDEEVLIIPY
ncbi:UDP-N-acetylenolpyruvoylglucosamine reductase [Candidatus Clavichlamydia salmonicola]|uniref:UDP-N-acetylmuramate dehydrogenase n=1 Tax=Candidatus Clavichlamydia salmonicola TaxID=469812 RepID=UPI0018916A9E|nr:UDP-N-acetylmuramate dehydrogenase [Candidatus Clavichlamydia salmonicola]MBF5050447.1 UDP-N-acetylenolpyruvoylglucosamine reductase [Candidatus Clavichlamydia salmonicola]